MAIGVDDLAKLILSGIDGSREERRRFFSKFVEPVYSEFEAIHEDFLIKFDQEYRQLILSPTHPLDLNHPLLARVAQDSRSTQHVRDKILKIGNFDDKITGDFYQAISSYLLDAYLSLDNPTVKFSNAPRSTFLKILRITFSELDSTSALEYYEQINLGHIILPSCELLILENNPLQGFTTNKHTSKITLVKRTIVISALNKMVEALQANFSLVLDEYAGLKKNLEK